MCEYHAHSRHATMNGAGRTLYLKRLGQKHNCCQWRY